MRPSQNTGIEMPISAKIVITRSDNLPAVTAETTPTRIPKKSQMIAAPMESENVAGMPCLDLRRRRSCWFVYDTRSPDEESSSS